MLSSVVPTIYDVAGINPPRVVDGIPQDPFDGVSFASTFNDAHAKVLKRTQYFEVTGSCAIYHDGWVAWTFGPRKNITTTSDVAGLLFSLRTKRFTAQDFTTFLRRRHDKTARRAWTSVVNR